ncbi:TIGR00659 family protein [Anaerovirgula multivorans]|uniref:TIGR00659 family protein n=1 Tax=Anaerovirgula multivorans TaxID=312168 RepID=A0A239JYJ7_9FIRM|nr:LrgB family protein [Anaerovirgula multivorans]SNT10538.1 TIGR00659 family protein [Anaerovirgula multivorans]
MITLLDTPYFGIVISILFFEIGLWICRKTKVTVLHPLLISILSIMMILAFFNIDIGYYKKGGDLISFFLGPATVILAVPLYRQLDLLKVNFVPIILGITVGCITAVTSVILLTRAFKLDSAIAASMIPKSVTTPIGLEISAQIGGIPSITVGVIVITGILGAVIGPTICNVFRIKDEVAIGIAMGTASHAVGTSKAMEMGETQGAMSGLAIGIAGLITVLLVPLLMHLF